MEERSAEDAARGVGAAPEMPVPQAGAARALYLLEHLQHVKPGLPRYSVRNFLDPKKQKRLMCTGPHQLVCFTTRRSKKTLVTPDKHLYSRIEIRESRCPFLMPWISWFLHSPMYRQGMLCLVLLVAIVNFIKIGLEKRINTHQIMNAVVEVAIWSIYGIFFFDIALKWVISFRGYWKNKWNVLDFAATSLSFIPEILSLFHNMEDTITYRIYCVLRILCTLKIFKFQKMQQLFMFLLKGTKLFSHALPFLLIFVYIFAVSGIYLFEDYTHLYYEHQPFENSFRNFPNAVITVFGLLLVDDWLFLLHDIWQVPGTNKMISGAYIMCYLMTVSFLFQSILWSTIEGGLADALDVLKEKKQYRKAVKQMHLSTAQNRERRRRQSDASLRSWSESSSRSGASELQLLGAERDGRASAASGHTSELQLRAEFGAPGGGGAERDEAAEAGWPLGVLCRCLELLEGLQHNLEERRRLRAALEPALLRLRDRPGAAPAPREEPEPPGAACPPPATFR